jgi:histone-lysine N-methyltransferase SETMAR
VNAETSGQSKQGMHTNSPNKSKKYKQTLSVCQKADGNSFLGQEGSADGGIHATRKVNNIRSVLRNTKKKNVHTVIQNKRHGMLTFGVVLLHDNVRPHTADGTRALLEHFNYKLFDHPPYSPDLASSDYHLFTYQKNWLRSQRFNNNMLMEDVKTWLSSQASGFFDTGIQKLIPRYDKCLNFSSDYIEK